MEKPPISEVLATTGTPGWWSAETSQIVSNYAKAVWFVIVGLASLFWASKQVFG
ncbi:hypothetical protein ASPZODRAFT_136907 [Penicilliopsis zonata CBS 506.65]|uniref:Uncharacterized protein n=1 Tax=Penicilliopsis zonata CBS 506.65 TaxID=1073090 RepID=A0A1L9S6G8_9EURO|nr:hypothetical protein ASPZODRAFT_136907 [Penicilliopsis zonata CBS 506.65]OJJ42766.1 hypothetical protein ASPZODRAFT_136907 [Penicilliopsis zonata CBS 506.65]